MKVTYFCFSFNVDNLTKRTVVSLCSVSLNQIAHLTIITSTKHQISQQLT